MTPPDPIALALTLARILEQLGVSYCIGGSFASSVYGEVRTTLDVDFVADLDSTHIDAFVAAVEPDFHVVDTYFYFALHNDSVKTSLYSKLDMRIS